MRLLFVDACISQRGPESRTRRLAYAFLEEFEKTHPDAYVTMFRVDKLGLKPLTAEALNERDARAGAGDFSGWDFRSARSFQSADAIVVAAPFWDLSFPAALRVYIEHISVNGLCYHYTEEGCQGDCRAKRLVYLTTGGDFEKPESLGVLYWKQLAAMFGIPRFEYVFAGGLDIFPERTEELLAPALDRARELAGEML